ncbi:MAG: single-stranded-DNA-specific exonuclease RecJ [Anaerolineales bacterium]|jgi:single-stranded-DNA-specific exonuclease
MTNELIRDEKIWQIESPITPQVDENLSTYPQVIRQILFNRGISTEEEAHSYFRAELPEAFHSARLAGLDEAVSRIAFAIENQEIIVVYGDYDVDGVTATALLTLALEAMGANVRPYIPNRFDEGYGLNNDAIDVLHEEGTGLIITVDCGIRSPEEARYAHQLGIDVIISDHHQPGNILPEAVAIINPKQASDPYPFKELAGVGLAYKIVEALVEQLEATNLYLPEFLDLVALGTVADLAPLTEENRTLVRRGMQSLKYTKHQGLLSLMMISRISPTKITASDIGFSLGPRLNAAGRLDSALAALDLLLTNDVATAGRLAQQLEIQNRERQKITRTIQKIAEQLAFQDEQDVSLLFAAHPDFNPGVVGLAASRLTEMYYRPAIVAYQGEHETRGSCRSIKEFHITDALDQCQDLLIRHGGHAAAAGFTVENGRLPELIHRLKQIAQDQLADQVLMPTLVADVEIPLHQLKPDLLKYIDMMEPTGYGNRQPHFISRELYVQYARAVGTDGAHLKLSVTDGLVTYDAIAFRLGRWLDKMPNKIDLLYTFELNEFNGRTNLQLNVKDIKPSV